MAASITHPALSSLCKINCNINGIYSLVSLNRRISISSVLSTSAVATEREATGRGGRGQWRSRRQAGEPRTERMAEDQDWTAVYPTAASFKPSAVPLPVRMGYPVKRGVPPAKKGNLELIKIPNFLHLTPVAIKKHCEALKPFCTKWPSALDSDEKCMEHFPIQVQSKEFVSAGLSLRNPDARIVTLKVKLSSLNLDDHARKKMIKLSDERYCKDTDTLTITTDSCPLRQQNYDYAMYLLTVLYHESWKNSARALIFLSACSGAVNPSSYLTRSVGLSEANHRASPCLPSAPQLYSHSLK
ncbi:28S ribosomal protein S35, mitochondrial isoform X2 [Ctenopharyngodon idella]|uniref:28S ribosomal protein S35, mitochondrial isoform X2 n=1 Tax=Ctenopharyngodon idella TaxID=7959 RepID=UPI002231E8CD|nr:28S ribosomal protein S35, mitochondrial isoform X2 [Ctenopharyngodon idella]